jgi:hypothetical protein
MRSRFRAVVLLVLLAASPCVVVADDDEPYWPSEQTDRLSEVDQSLLDIVDQRRKARAAQDKEKLKELDEEWKKLSEEKVELLRATGDL